jgi:uncharacterized protein YkwD
MSINLPSKTSPAAVAIRLAAALVLSAAVVPHAAPALTTGSPWVDSRLELTEAEAAYGTAADEVSLADAREQLLGLVNSARAEAGLAELDSLALAAAVAQDQAGAMVAHRLVGHYDAAGRTCELRFNAAGGLDQVSENTAYYEIDYDVHLTPQLVSRIQAHWLASPGHRANILDPAHTHLGAGFQLQREGGQTRVAAVTEFVNDYGDYAPLPAHARLGDVLQLSGQLDPARATLSYLGLGVADPPHPIAPGQAQKPGYSTPEVVLALVPLAPRENSEPAARYIRPAVNYDRRTGEFAARIVLEKSWPPAAYYFTAWARTPAIDEPPFCVMVQVVLVE